MKLTRWLLATASLASAASTVAANETLKLSPIWSDHIVVQRDVPVVIEGWAKPASRVEVDLNGAKTSTTADNSGEWRAELPAMAEGGPYKLSVQGDGGQSASIDDIMLGDVWLCSGQSNMELPVSRALDFESEMGKAADPLLRVLTVPKAAVPKPQSTFAEPASWLKAERATVADFSAACYFMGKDLRSRIGVAIGLVDASWGGTQIKAWLSPDATRAIYGAAEADLLETYNDDPLKAVTIFAPSWEDWWRKTTGTAKGKEPWNDARSVTWKPLPAVGPWEQWPDGSMANFNGWAWAKRDLTLTAAQIKQGATLHLGVIDDMDQTWVNGKAVGNSFGWSLERAYRIPGDYFKAGANRITIAIGDSWGAGGFQGPASKLKLELADGTIIPLAEGWEYSKADFQGNPPRTPWDTNAGLGLIHNGMIAPLGGFRFKGAAWYQGESDVGIAGYDKRMAALVKGWRSQFGNPGLATAIVSLANYGTPPTQPTDSGWAKLREEQRQAAIDIPNATLVQAIDIGDRTDIHPANKNELGRRLGRVVAILTGTEKQQKSGPSIQSARLVGNEVIVQFGNVNGALKSWGSAYAISFELCGVGQASCRFAKASADGSSVRIPADGQAIREVRYAWADSPVVNLYDSDNLPVEPFRMELSQ